MANNLFIVFCLLLTTTSKIGHASSLSDEELEFGNLLKTGQEKLNLRGNDELTVLVGVSGSGKSTLATFLTKSPTLHVKQGKGRVCLYTDGDTIGTQSQTSKTTVPNTTIDPETGSVLVDCPGFEDTRKNPANDIAAAFFIRKVFNAARKVKIVIVENHNSVTFYKDRHAILRTLSHIAKLIPDPRPLRGALGFIVTKVSSSENDEDIVESVREYINDTLVEYLIPEREKLNNGELSDIRRQTESEIAVAEALLAPETTIGVFRTPCKSESNDCVSCTDVENLRYLVFNKMQFAETESSMFHMTVSDKSALFITDKLLKNLETVFEEKISKLISTDLHYLDRKVQSVALTSREKLALIESKLIEYSLLFNSLKMHNSFVTFTKSQRNWNFFHHETLNDLAFDVEKMNFFHDCVEGDAIPFVTELRNKNYYNITMHCEKMTAEIKSLDTIRDFMLNLRSYKGIKLIRSVPVNISDYSEFMHYLVSAGMGLTTEMKIVRNNEPSPQLIHQIRKIVQSGGFKVPANIKIQENDLVVTGFYIFLSEIVDKIKTVHHTVYIIVSGKFFIDSDLHLKDTHLVIFTLAIEVVDLHFFNMIGSDGANGKNYGNVGNPGFSSGTLRIFANTVLNGRQLRIHLSGGTGGDGQKGHDGNKGKESKFKAQVYLIVDCFIHSNGKCERQSYLDDHGIIEMYDLDFLWKHHCLVTVISKNGITAQAGGRGGYGGPGGFAGRVVISKSIGQDFTLFSTNGCNGQNGADGKSVPSCVIQRTRLGCRISSHLFDPGTGWVDQCTVHEDYCQHYDLSPNYTPRQPRKSTIKHLYLFQEPTSERQMQIFLDVIFSLFDNLELDQGYLENTKGFITNLLEAMIVQNASILEPVYHILNHLATKKISPPTKMELLHHTNQLFQTMKLDIHKDTNSQDVTTLEALLFSCLDFTETLQSRKVIVKLKSKLELFKNEIENILLAWRNSYKQSAVTDHKNSLLLEIKGINDYSKSFVEEKLQNVEIELKDQFDLILRKVSYEKEKVEQNVQELRKQEKEIAGNLWKRILFGSLRLVAGVASIFQQAVGTTMEMVVSASEQLAIRDRDSQIKKLTVPNAVANVQSLMVKFEKQKQKNAASRAEFQLSVAEEVLRLDRRMGSNLLSESSRNRLEEVLTAVDGTELANVNIKNVLETCEEELKKVDVVNGDVTQTLQMLKVAKHATVLTTSAISDIRKIQRNEGVMSQLQVAIRENEQILAQLDTFEKSLDKYFQPFLKEMQLSFKRFTNDAEGFAQHLLIFRKFDLQKLTREFASLVRKFTDGFADEQSELIGVVEDLEALAMANMNAQAHINDLDYKIRLASLLGTITLDDEECSNPTLCSVRKNATNALKTNAILQQHTHLANAFQQAIFPFRTRHRLVHLLPHENLQTTVAEIRQQVNAMSAELAEREDTIDVSRDQELRFHEFSSSLSSSEPFFRWRQQQHADQIGRFLRGEKVMLVADVRGDRRRNAIKFHQIGLDIIVPRVDVRPLLQFLELEMTHGGDNHFRCGDFFYAILGNPLTFQQSFEVDANGQPILRNSVFSKFSLTDVPYSPFTSWTMQLKPGVNPMAMEKFKELAQYTGDAHLELVGKGTFIENNATVCQDDLSQYFDLFN